MRVDIINLGFDGWTTILFRINWVSVILLVLGLLIIGWICRLVANKLNSKSITIEEVNLGVGNSSVRLTIDRKDQEIAYKLWVELSTRKIGLLFDEEHDVITEVYNSWYEFFKIARELLKDIPADRIAYSNDLIELTERVLNNGLRPHLTIWQAKFRKWYENEVKADTAMSPQEIQKRYPEYEELVKDLLLTNKHMIEYKNLMKRIAFERHK